MKGDPIGDLLVLAMSLGKAGFDVALDPPTATLKVGGRAGYSVAVDDHGFLVTWAGRPYHFADLNSLAAWLQEAGLMSPKLGE